MPNDDLIPRRQDPQAERPGDLRTMLFAAADRCAVPSRGYDEAQALLQYAVVVLRTAASTLPASKGVRATELHVRDRGIQ